VELLKKLRRPEKPGDKSRWEDLTGDEQVVIANPGELTDDQSVSTTTNDVQHSAGHTP